MVRISLTFLFFYVLLCANVFGQDDDLRKASQLIIVSTSSWTSTKGTLELYSKSDGKWVRSGKAVQVVLGRGGLGWGLGLHKPPQSGPQKNEGDGRSPAGIFSLGPAFGYALLPPAGCRLSYKSITSRDYFVDDPESEQYNTWVRIPDSLPNDPKRHWRTAETMLSGDSLYEFGLVVRHNMSPVLKAKGSAIFLHLCDTRKTPTAGCTAMARADLLMILDWLDPMKNPLILQAPIAQIPFLKSQLGWRAWKSDGQFDKSKSNDHIPNIE